MTATTTSRGARPVEVFGARVARLLAGYGAFCALISYGTVWAAALALGASELFAAVAPLGLDLAAVIFTLGYLASLRHQHPDAGMKTAAHALIAATVVANGWAGYREGGPYLAGLHAVFPAALAVLIERFARVERRIGQDAAGAVRIPARLWARHPVGAARAWLWLARVSTPAFDRARHERDQQRAAGDAVRIALPGRRQRRARAGVLRSLTAGRLLPITAVQASGLLDRHDVPALYRAALIADLRGTPQGTGEDTDDTAAREVPGGTDGESTASATRDSGETRPGPDVPESPPGPEPVLTAVPDAVADDARLARDLRAWSLVLDKRPSLREIGSRYRIGKDRAKRVRDLSTTPSTEYAAASPNGHQPGGPSSNHPSPKDSGDSGSDLGPDLP